MKKNPHAVALGRKGGSMTSESKAEAARKNGKLGGRPRALSENVDPFGIPEPISEMANLGPKLTGGLPKVIHIWHEGEDAKGPHGARVKASFYSDRFDKKKNVSISVSDDPQVVAPKGFKFGPQLTKKDFAAIRAWILKRKDKLLRYWIDSSITVDEIISDEPAES